MAKRLEKNLRPSALDFAADRIGPIRVLPDIGPRERNLDRENTRSGLLGTCPKGRSPDRRIDEPRRVPAAQCSAWAGFELVSQA